MAAERQQGGVQHVSVSPGRAGQRLDNFLARELGRQVPRSLVYRLIKSGQVRINGGRCKPRYRLKSGDDVRIPPVRQSAPAERPVPDELRADIQQAIVYRDDRQLVVDKPAGLAVHAGSGLSFGLVDVLKALLPDYPELAPVHRLDRDTSGCMLIGLTREALIRQQQELRRRNLRKLYLALAVGAPREALLEVDLPLAKHRAGQRAIMRVDQSGKPALTRFRLLQRFEHYSLLQAEPLTGRTHQIRAHALARDIPLAGDRLYLAADPARRRRQQQAPRLFLHAVELRLNWPGDIVVHAPLPEPLRWFLDQLQQ